MDNEIAKVIKETGNALDPQTIAHLAELHRAEGEIAYLIACEQATQKKGAKHDKGRKTSR